MCKRVVLAVLLSMAGLSVFGQSLDKMIKDAVQKGNGGTGVYRIENPQNKDISTEKACWTLEHKGFIPLYWKSVAVERFGSIGSVFKYVAFTTEAEKDLYKYSQVGFRGVLADLKSVGSFYYAKEDLYKKINRLVRVDGALWSGDVVDGLLEGSGYGLIQKKGQYTTFVGSFVHGLPVGITQTRSLEQYLSDPPRISEKDYSSKNYISVDNQVLISNIDSEDKQLCDLIRIYAKEIYADNVQKLNEVYKQVDPVSMSTYDRVNEDNTPELFKNLYTKVNYDPQNMIPLAEEIFAVYGTVAALKLTLRDTYADETNWGLTWFLDDEKTHRNVLENGLVLSKQYVNSKYGFADFFDKASASLSKKTDLFEQRIKYDRGFYENETALRQKRREDAYYGNKAKTAMDVDESRSKAPSGKLVQPGIFDERWRYETGGTIYFKGGDYFHYNILYNDKQGREFWEYVANSGDGRYSGSFKTMDEMLSAMRKHFSSH